MFTKQKSVMVLLVAITDLKKARLCSINIYSNRMV